MLVGYMRISTNDSDQVASWQTMQAVLDTNVVVSALCDHHLLALGTPPRHPHRYTG
jgi:hypothetical protein